MAVVMTLAFYPGCVGTPDCKFMQLLFSLLCLFRSSMSKPWELLGFADVSMVI